MSGKVWTKKEVDKLIWFWGERLPSAIAKKLGKTEAAVKQKARRIGLQPFSDCSQYMSLDDVVRRTGYYHEAIKTVCLRLNLKIKRGPDVKCRRYYFREGEVVKIEEELRRLADKRNIYRYDSSYSYNWGGKKPDACMDCGTSSKPYCGRGLCKKCYDRMRQLPQEWRER
jgi:hypothetical protein